VHHRRHRRPWGHRGLGARWYSQENVLERLEEYRRDLEQELADVSDLIRRLEKDAPQAGGEPATTTV
jgi:hypothetical protein